MGDRQFRVPISDIWHGHDANLSWDTIGSRGGAFALTAPGWQGVLPDGVEPIEMSAPLGWLLPRIAAAGPADLPATEELQKGFALVPLSQWGEAG
jgi:hypothetical protein